MKTNKLSNSARALILVIAIVILTIVSAKADMVKVTYSPYKCSMDYQHKDNEVNDMSTLLKITIGDPREFPNRRFNFKGHPEEKKIKDEVRRFDVTSSKPKLMVEIKSASCEHGVYKII